ncbi:sulfatase [Novipirellula rosea]|uniref:Sulfatase n=1 Tax=Novipirellula rosea TaxID=1031540 RepID=A0ABP8MCJ5_9BACT
MTSHLTRTYSAAIAITLLIVCTVSAADKPNMVIFVADDHGWKDSSVYGSPSAKTPNMQALADKGMVFDRAFVASPACGPSRAALLSGLMPARNGAEPNHQMPRPDTLSMVKQLQTEGYEVVAFGKVGHGKETEMAGFDHAQDYPKGRNRDGIKRLVRDYFAKRESDQPLCLMVGDHRPHVSWIKETSYNADDVVLPVGSVDTTETRQHWARYLADVTGMDAMIGEVDRMAKAYFGNDDYLFLYSADHGAQWPFGKWNLYDTGTRTPLIVRWPGHITPGVRSDAMVSWIDLMPTLIEFAGGTVPEGIDGRSFADVLRSKRNSHREVIYTTHSGDGNRNVYPIRAVRDDRFKYIRNLRPDCYHSNHSDIDRKDGAGAYWDSWDEAARTDPKAAAIVAKYYQRPAVEFYDLANDPDEQHNLANDPTFANQVKKMSAMLDALDGAAGRYSTDF